MKNFCKKGLFAIHYSLSTLLVLLLVGCQKETDFAKDVIVITTEKHQSQDKTSVRYTNVQWATGDTIKSCVGDSWEENLAVKILDGKAYVESYSGKTGIIRAYYPKTIVDNGKTNTPTITIPNRYNCIYNNGRQVIALPMAALAESGANKVNFKHLTAGIMVVLRNETTSSMIIDSVIVSSKNYKLSGTLELNLAAADMGVVAQTTSDSNSVTVRFTDHPSIAYSGYDTVQVPILPIGATSCPLRIEVYTHCQGSTINISGVPSVNSTVIYHYSDKKDVSDLGRNVIMTARIAISSSGAHTKTDTIDNSLFSVSRSTKVHFSKGNLKHTSTTSKATEWSFHTNQYDYLGTSQSNDARDLFGWGTKTNPDNVSTTDADYTWNDWGENTISDAGTGWRTLSGAEWTYLVDSASRSATRYLKTRIYLGGSDYRNGLVLFPDKYIHPYNLAALNKNYVNHTDIDYSTTTFTLSDWISMQSAGAIFLPAAGYRDESTVSQCGGEGDYWSSTEDASNKAKRLEFKSNELTSSNSTGRHYGYSVRLVK